MISHHKKHNHFVFFCLFSWESSLIWASQLRRVNACLAARLGVLVFAKVPSICDLEDERGGQTRGTVLGWGT